MIHCVIGKLMKTAPLHLRVSRARLEHLYVHDGLSTLDLAAILGSNRESVRRLIHRYGLPMRAKHSGKVKTSLKVT